MLAARLGLLHIVGSNTIHSCKQSLNIVTDKSAFGIRLGTCKVWVLG